MIKLNLIACPCFTTQLDYILSSARESVQIIYLIVKKSIEIWLDN